jgi:hypothetical protein
MTYHWLLVEGVSPPARRMIRSAEGIAIDIAGSLVLVGIYCCHLEDGFTFCGRPIDNEMIVSCTGLHVSRSGAELVTPEEIYQDGIPPDWKF